MAHVRLEEGAELSNMSPVGTEPEPEDTSGPVQAEMTRLGAIKHILTDNKMNVLLICVPFGFISQYGGWGDSWVFIFCFLSMVPLAFLLGTATEELAQHTNQTFGGLLNATFGNATELIISIFALKEGLLRVVQASLLGSILSNLLLVLGCAFLFGGIRYPSQKFNQTASLTSSSLLALAMMGMLTPAAFYWASEDRSDTNPSLVLLSRFVALFLLIIYICFLIFQLKTHKYLYEEEGDDEEESILTVKGALALLAVTTILVAILSEYLVGSIQHVSTSWGISQTFIGIVLIPIVGNAAEHVTAVTVAMKNKMELSIGVAVGSSTQIALFVVPLLVLMGWVMGRELTLYFHVFETAVAIVTIIIVHIIISDGESNWLEGITLICAYCIVCIGFLLIKEPASSSAGTA